MKTKELRALSVDDLVKKEQDVREELENPAKLAVLKKDIARIQTVLTEKKNQ